MSATGAKRRFLKAVRSTVRLKHSLRADAELEYVLPIQEALYDEAIALGKSYEFATSSLLLELESGSDAVEV